jgi:hypothetical protein
METSKLKSIFVGDRLSVVGTQKWNQNCFCLYNEGESIVVFKTNSDFEIVLKFKTVLDSDVVRQQGLR